MAERRPEIGAIPAQFACSASELHDRVAADGELGTLGAASGGRKGNRACRHRIEGLSVVQGRVKTNLGSEDQRLDQAAFRHVRRDVQAKRERAISRLAAADDGRWQAELGIHKIEIARKGVDEEGVGIRPNLGPSNNLENVIDLIAKILRHAAAGNIEAIVAYIVQVCYEGKIVSHLPCYRDVVEVSESAIGIAQASRSNRRHVGIFRTNVGGCEDCNRTIQ